MKGGHWLKSWSSTQKNVTLSSGEAELVAAVKMSAELIGLAQLAQDWGEEVEGHVHIDSAAAYANTKPKVQRRPSEQWFKD